MSLQTLTVTQALEILGLPQGAGYQDVRTVFLALSKTHHPDVAGDQPEAQDQYRRILEAYRYLNKNRSFLEPTAELFTAAREPAPGQGRLFTDQPFLKAPVEAPPSQSATPQLSPAEAWRLIQASHNPYLRQIAVEALAGHLDRPGTLKLLGLLPKEENASVTRAMVKTLSLCDIPLARVGLRLYLVRRAGFLLRREFMSFLKPRRKNSA